VWTRNAPGPRSTTPAIGLSAARYGFACTARQRIRLESGGCGRDQLRALAQRVEIADTEVRIMGSKSELLRHPVAASGRKSVAFGVQSSV
jgi:hypothetical protein